MYLRGLFHRLPTDYVCHQYVYSNIHHSFDSYLQFIPKPLSLAFPTPRSRPPRKPDTPHFSPPSRRFGLIPSFLQRCLLLPTGIHTSPFPGPFPSCPSSP